MRVTYITAGAADMICGSCLRDNALVRKLREQGCEVTLVPVYTPITVEEEDFSTDKLLLGGISVYLEQSSRLFRKLPNFLTNWLDHPSVVKFFTSRKPIQVEAENLGNLTLSILEGENGNQKRSFNKAFKWIQEEAKPEILNFSNLLIAGLAPKFKSETNLPIVVTLQGDDLFINDFKEDDRNKIIEKLKIIAASVDAFITFSEFYSEKMATLLDIPIEKFHIINLGIDAESFSEIQVENSESRTIGYFGRIAPEKGFHNAINSFIEINKGNTNEKVSLVAGGWLSEADKDYFNEQLEKINSHNLSSYFEYIGSPDLEKKKELFKRVKVFTLPTDQDEPKGLSVLEAQASGIPVIQPNKGIFPEMLSKTKGGILYNAEDSSALSKEILALLDNPARAAELGGAGRRNTLHHFSDNKMATDTYSVYEKLLARQKVSK